MHRNKTSTNSKVSTSWFIPVPWLLLPLQVTKHVGHVVVWVMRIARSCRSCGSRGTPRDRRAWPCARHGSQGLQRELDEALHSLDMERQRLMLMNQGHTSAGRPLHPPGVQGPGFFFLNGSLKEARACGYCG